ncbi:MAG: hypothetical protein RXN87_05305 [Acidilobus sp.]
MGLRRSQSAIVGALIIAIVMFASLATALYLMNQYSAYSRLSTERSQVLSEAAELQRTANAYWNSSPTSTGTNVTITLSSGYPYAYEVTDIVLGLSNGSLLIYGPGAYPGFLSVVTASGSQYWLPASSPAGGSVNITLSFRHPVQVQAVSLVLQSGDAVAAVAALPHSHLLAQQQGGSSSSGSQGGSSSSGSQGGSSSSGSQGGSSSSGSQGGSSSSGSNNAYIVVAGQVYKVLNLTPIILYNPTNQPTPDDLTVNLTINLNNAMVEKYSTTYSVNGVNVPLANVLFAYRTGTQWDPLNGWIESFNSSAATVWVRLDMQIQPYSNLTIYMLFVNGTTLGTTSWGVNSYYTQDPSLDNIGYVMQSGILYEVYVDENGTLFLSAGVYEYGFWTTSGGFVLSDYCDNQFNGYGSMVGFSYGGLAGFLYSLPLYDVASSFFAPYGYCVVYSGPMDEPILYYSPQDPPIAYYTYWPQDINIFNYPLSYFANGTFKSYGEPSVAVPSDESVYDWQGYPIPGYDVIFNYQTGFPVGQSWPYGLQEAPEYQNDISWLVKGVGWVQVINPDVTIATTTDDGTIILLKNSPGGGSFTSWLGSSWKEYELLPVWATDYNDNWPGPVTFEAPLNSTLTGIGDYRVEILYYQDIGTSTYFAVFVPSSSMASYLSWYAPVFPPGGSYPYAFAPGLLLGPSAPVQGWIVG